MDVFDLYAKISLDTSGYDAGLQNASNTTKSFGSRLGSGLKSAAKLAATAFTAISGAAVAATGAFISGAKEVAEYGDNIDKMSQKMGMSAEAYQEWDAVMQHSGTSMETMKAGMKTLANAVENGNEAFKRIGLTQEELAKMSQEDIFAATIEGLQNVEDVTERTYLAGQLLGRGATELGALLNTSAEETQAMRDRVHELGGVMSDEAVKASARFQDNLQDMKTAMSGIKRAITSDLLPGLNLVMEGFTSLIIGEEGGVEAFDEGFRNIIDTVGRSTERVFGIMEQIGPTIFDTLMSALPQVLNFGMNLVGNIVTGISNNMNGIVTAATSIIDVFSSNIGNLFDTGTDLIVSLVEGVTSALPQLLTSLGGAAKTIAEKMTDPTIAKKLFEAGLNLIKTLAEGFIKGVPALIKEIPVIIRNVLTMIGQAAPQLISTVVELVGMLVESLPEIITGLLNAIPDIIQMVVDTIITLLPVFIDGIIQLVTMIADNLPEILTAIIDALPMIIQSIIDALMELVPALVQGAIQLTIGVLSHLPEIIAAIIQAIPQIIEAIIMGFMPLSDRVVGLFSDIGTAVSNWWSNLKQSIADGWNTFIENVKTWFEQLPYNLGYALADMIIKLGEWYTQAKEWVSTNVSKLIESIVNWFAGLPRKIWNWLVETITKIGNWITETDAKVKAEIPRIIDNIVSFFEELPAKAWNWGVDMITNFIDGIKHMAQQAWDAVESFAQGIADRLGFSEPELGPLSNFHTYAPDMMELFAQGIKDNADIVNDAIADNFDFSDAIVSPEVDYQQIYQSNTESALNQMISLLQQLVDNGMDVTLEGDAREIFNVVEKQNRQRTKATGYNSLAMAGG